MLICSSRFSIYLGQPKATSLFNSKSPYGHLVRHKPPPPFKSCLVSLSVCTMADQKRWGQP